MSVSPPWRGARQAGFAKQNAVSIWQMIDRLIGKVGHAR
jgi:hypothetical protein